MNAFYVPTKIYTGEAAFENLKQYPIHNLCIICDPFVEKSGMVNKLLRVLDEMGAQYRIFSDITPDPNTELVVQGLSRIVAHKPDAVLAMGGGSAIDAAKAISYMYQKTTGAEKPLCIAVPTTSGTGSEATSFAVITDAETHIKYPITDDKLLPNIAILDHTLVRSVPPAVTADTGMDVLTHAIEAYVSTLNSPFTDPLAIKAIEMVLDFLPASYNGNQDAREQMHYAQCLAGQAFSNALLGIVHSMAHKTGAAFSTGHIPHGCANAIYLPYVIKYNAHEPEAKRRYADIARRVGLGGTSEESQVNALCEKIKEFNRTLNIPSTLKEFGIDEAEFKSKVAEIAANAVGDACTGSNPRSITPEQMEKLFVCTYYGTEVDF